MKNSATTPQLKNALRGRVLTPTNVSSRNANLTHEQAFSELMGDQQLEHIGNVCTAVLGKLF